MSLANKSDVKKHLSVTDTSVYPFGLKRSDGKTTGTPAEVADLSISPAIRFPLKPYRTPR